MRKRCSVAMQVNTDDSFYKINTELQTQMEAWKLRAKELETAWEISSSNEEKLRTRVSDLETQLQKNLEILKEGTELAKNIPKMIEETYRNAVIETATDILSMCSYYDTVCSFKQKVIDRYKLDEGN